MDQSGTYVAKEGTSCAVQEDLPNSSELHLKSPEEWNREVQQFLYVTQYGWQGYFTTWNTSLYMQIYNIVYIYHVYINT